MIRKSIPHIFTFLNLFFGCAAVFLAFSHYFTAALIAVILGVFCDFFDGFFARLLGVESDLGVQLDSLADMVTSGLVPGVIMYQLLVISGSHSIDFSFNFQGFNLVFTLVPLALIGFLITLGAAFRLAKFNLITEKVPYFRGVPTPANALFIGALPLFFNHPLLVNSKDFLLTPFALILITILSVFFMNIHWKMIALKGFTRSNPMSILMPLILLVLVVPVFYFFGLSGFVIAIILYIFLSLLENVLGI
ncbi:CDP-alcohol phosphatidyltransferase family protein [Flavobacteriaceae bacterium]|jgi:CDP-diacylglycerol--serine O-phosphatidyltransferase|uniref:CDP-alcohol phosphatidyltransferase family protein n=1 Tax=Candidatus Arcticimaribacter forsetii TaxID=2820661 RepID=UPI00207784D5|nr:CDP-alcohol phosphatidyltransferase family protein [Candidatus Arcticimaribacter forsetii]MDB4751692.1 CDP-alcohol phosphatidyltransferase family protein [Flavobacteriaceae bacterium]